jgi:catechol 2,3-dioxygenase-like lactoylglutathione lyase family enzyme
MSELFNHVDVVVTSLERSVPFYRQLLRRLGQVGEGFITGERGEHVVYLGTGLGLREAQSAGAVDRYALGLHHLAFDAASRAVVDDVGAWAQDVESGPGEYDYSPGYYAVFFYDPDGLKLEVVHQP